MKREKHMGIDVHQARRTNVNTLARQENPCGCSILPGPGFLHPRGPAVPPDHLEMSIPLCRPARRSIATLIFLAREGVHVRSSWGRCAAAGTRVEIEPNAFAPVGACAVHRHRGASSPVSRHPTARRRRQ
jgi:hypothetical protein